MNREFKFKLYQKGKLVGYETFTKKGWRHRGLSSKGERWCPGVIFSDSDSIRALFTGLYDIRGKEIYEGDILNHGDHYNSEVIWLEESARFCLREMGYVKREISKRHHDMNYLTFAPTILGNIYENPEL